MRVLIKVSLLVYAVSALQFTKTTAQDELKPELGSSKIKAYQKRDVKNTLLTVLRRVARSAEDITTDNVNEGVSEANDLTEELAEEARWAAEERKWQEQAKAQSDSASLDGTAASIETTTHKLNEIAPEANNQAEESAEEARWAAEEEKWQELAKAEAASVRLEELVANSEATTLSYDENEEVEESNDLTKELVEQELWAAEERKWRESANADTAAAVLDGLAASEDQDNENTHTDGTEIIEPETLAGGGETKIVLMKSEVFHTIFPGISIIPNYNYWSWTTPESYTKLYQYSQIYNVPDIFRPYIV